MNVVITLPKHLLDKIISGDKKFEMRKSIPRKMIIGKDGFFVVEKGTDDVRCWCRVDKIEEFRLNQTMAVKYSNSLCVSSDFIMNYAPPGTKVYLWVISIVIELEGISRNMILDSKNPQSFAYTIWTI